ncbi:hypothetical protein VTL71DRAFT_3652 [Oculimacula yallundae]|uniref:Heterokaryon incompatibility domain-containing protein n=1 Tax=Oculimacula yallundae TaxID=86028 RepID=A0ABR4C3K5_9HELO
MSTLSIGSKIRVGSEPRLDQATPFVPDVLCEQCLVIFQGDYKSSLLTPNTLHIDRETATACRLCALLIFKFGHLNPARVLDIEYFLFRRSGYYASVCDVIFPLADSPVFNNSSIIRLALHKISPTNEDGNMTYMVHPKPNLSSSDDSHISMLQAEKWFKECLEQHEMCTFRFPGFDFVPSRLIEIRGSSLSNLSVRLQERQSLPGKVRYATLSHCWGTCTPFKLTSQNLADCKDGLPMHNLNKAFQDAIGITYRLGIRYLWIDSVCIIQDSLDDWELESSDMGAIYNHGILNIAATAFTDGANGLFVKRDPDVLIPIGITKDEDQCVSSRGGSERDDLDLKLKKGNYLLMDAFVWKEGIDEAPLCKRGWVTQERALSVRTLYFGKEQLFWECCSHNASEGFPTGFPDGTFMAKPKSFLGPQYPDKQERLELAEPVSIRGMTLEQTKWLLIVLIYTQCSLTFGKDKLVAISGLAGRLSKDIGCKYLAGLWRRDLEHQLLWKVNKTYPAPKQGVMRGPSWSWASVDGAIDIPSWHGFIRSNMPGEITWLSKVDSAQTCFAGPDEFGQVRSGILHITGRLGVFRIEKAASNDPAPQDEKLLTTNMELDISWDTVEVEDRFGKSSKGTCVGCYSQYGFGHGPSIEDGLLDVFYLPVRIMTADPNSCYAERPMLTGLLLLPTGDKGQFRRVGQSERVVFQGEDDWEGLTETTNILDARFFSTRQNHGEYSISVV